MRKPIIKLQNASKRYCGRQQDAMRDVNIQIFPGEQVAIIGRSASGKSTLLNVLSTLDIAEGKYEFLYHNATFCYQNVSSQVAARKKSEVRERIGFIFQTPFMLSNFDVFYNIALPLIVKGEKEERLICKTRRMLKQLGLEKYAHSTADKLSVGQRQRVTIGRALVHSPAVVFADEPTGSLDIYTAREVMGLLQRICYECKAALILVTHDIHLAWKHCDFARFIGITGGKIAFDDKKNNLVYDDLCHFISENTMPRKKTPNARRIHDH